MTFDEILHELTEAVYASYPEPTVDEDIEANKEIWYVYRQNIIAAMAEAERQATIIFNGL